MKTASVLVWIALSFYGAICIFRDVSESRWTPTKTYVVHDHIWTPKIDHILIDDWEDVLAGYDSLDDAFRAAQVHIKRVDKEFEEDQ